MTGVISIIATCNRVRGHAKAVVEIQHNGRNVGNATEDAFGFSGEATDWPSIVRDAIGEAAMKAASAVMVEHNETTDSVSTTRFTVTGAWGGQVFDLSVDHATAAAWGPRYQVDAPTLGRELRKLEPGEFLNVRDRALPGKGTMGINIQRVA